MDRRLRILIVDDEKIVRESFHFWFQKSGHFSETAASGIEALEKMERVPFDLLFVDIRMPGMDGLQLLERLKMEYPDTMVVIITAYGTIETAVKAMRIGAADYLLKPFNPDQLNLVVEKILQQEKMAVECRYLRGRLDKAVRFDNIIGASQPMASIFALIPEVAASDASVLIVGETGTGKELIAKAIHAKSPRRSFPYVTINCGAIPDTLLESELFGHQKGAFTGADHARKGYLEVVHGGTLFLDEIGEISQKMQVDLLRVLEEKKVTRIGSCQPLDVDFRLISATRRDLEKRITENRFRRDFFYRINVIVMQIPPLRERKEDIPLLVDCFLTKYSQETNKWVDRISSDTMHLLQQYDWPGNVRELENAVERAVVLSRSRTLKQDDFSFLRTAPSMRVDKPSLKENEKAYIRKILEECEGNITRAAKVLEINRVTLHKKMKRFQLTDRGI